MGELLRSAVSALPTVATHPLAFVAYTLVVAAWLAIAWRVKRNKNLLEHLDKLPANARLQALEREMGHVPIKGGLSPEQYLRSRIHLYYLVGFGMICALILLIFVISASVSKKKEGEASIDVTLSPVEPSNSLSDAQAEPPSTDGVHVGVISRLRKGASEDKGRKDSKLAEIKYTYERVGEKVLIKPSVPYLAWLQNGGVINGSGGSLNQVYPELSVKVVNNTEETIYLTEAVVSVKSSAIDKEPLIEVGEEEWDALSIGNAGWGNVINPRISFGVADANDCGKYDPKNSPLKHSISLKTFSESIDVPMEPYVYVPPSIERQGNTMTFNPHPRTHACIYGKIDYATEDSVERTVWFMTTMWVGSRERVLRNAMLSTAKYKLELEAGLQVRAGEAGYSKRIPISQYIKPGEVDHFKILVVADKSARFNLSFDFLTAGGKVLRRREVILNTFVPRYWEPYEVKEINSLK